MQNKIDQEMLGVRVESRPLTFPVAQELLPVAVTFAARAGEMIAKLGDVSESDVLKLVTAIDPVAANELMALLVKHDRKLLSRTTVTMPSATGDLETYELANEKDRGYVFEARPDLFVPLCILAGRVTFERFFPVAGPLAGGAARATA